MGAAEKLHVPGDYIEQTPGVCGGKPRIRDTRMKVSDVAWRHVHNGQPLDDIIEGFPHLTLAQLHAALAYYYDHRDVVEAEIREEEASLDRIEKSDGASQPGR